MLRACSGLCGLEQGAIRGDDALGGQSAHPDGAVDVLIAGSREVAAGELDRSDRRAEVGTVAVQTAEVEARGVGAAGPLLAAPVALVVDDRVLRLGAVVVRQ